MTQNEQVVDLLAGILDAECVHLLTVRTCTACKDKLFHRGYAKRYDRKEPEVESVEDEDITKLFCVLCKKARPTSKKRATVRLPLRHGVLETHFANPWCDHANGKCVYDLPTMHGPTVELPKVNKATHRLPDGRPVCDECCDGHCKRCHDAFPGFVRGKSLGFHPDNERLPRSSRPTQQEVAPLSTSDAFG